MLILLSPAKTLTTTGPVPKSWRLTEPAFLAQAKPVADTMRGMSHADTASLLNISDKLAEQVLWWHQLPWAPAGGDLPEDAKLRPAALMFAGDVYTGLDAPSWTTGDAHHAQKTLRILSGMYGLLRPLDQIQPYRLQMGSKLAVATAANLYDYWRPHLAPAVTQAADQAPGGSLVVNLASTEYSTAAALADSDTQVITPVFLDEAPSGEFKVMSFFAKRARGLMARWLVTARVTSARGVYDFAEAGYRYDQEATARRSGAEVGAKPAAPVFVRSVAERPET